MSNTTTFPYGSTSIQLIIKSEKEYWLQINNLEAGVTEEYPIGSRVQLQLAQDPAKLYVVTSEVNFPDWPHKEIAVSTQDLLMFRLTPEDPDFITCTLTYLKRKAHQTFSWNLECCESIYLYIAKADIPTFYIYYHGDVDCPCFTEFGKI